MEKGGARMKILSKGEGEMRCSDLDMPLLTSEAVQSVIIPYMCAVVNDQWLLLAKGEIEDETTIQLIKMCQELVRHVTRFILKAVTPQIEEWKSMDETNQSAEDRNYQWVTQEDVEACVGETMHCCFGEALGFFQEKSDDSRRLSDLLVDEVMRNINNMLSPEDGEESVSSRESQTGDMVFYVIQIFRSFFRPRGESEDEYSYTDEEEESPECPDKSGSHSSRVDKGTEVNTEGKELVLSNCPVADLFKVEALEDRSSQRLCESKGTKVEDAKDKDKKSVLSGGQDGRVETPEAEDCHDDVDCEDRSVVSGHKNVASLVQQERTFLTVLLWKFVDHVASSTRTSVLDVDVNGMVERLTAVTVGKIDAALPQTVGNIHISIYKDLSRQYGSEKLLQAAMASGDAGFEEAVARTLIARLNKPARKKCSFLSKLKRLCTYGRRSKKVVPVCKDTPVLHSEDKEKNASPPTPGRKQKTGAIRTILSSAARILKKPFSSCISGGSEGD